jgi:hypothetical protein
MRNKGPRSIPDFSRHPTQPGDRQAAPASTSGPTPKPRVEPRPPQVKPQATSGKSGQRGK